MVEMDGGAAEKVLWDKILSNTLSVLGRIALIGKYYNAQSDEYHSKELTTSLAATDLDIALRRAHKLVWREWLGFSLEAQEADLQLYLRSLPVEMGVLLARWRDTKAFLAFVPSFALAEEREIFASNLTVIVMLLCNEYALDVPRPQALPPGSAGLAAKALQIVREQYSDSGLSLHIVSETLRLSDDYLGRLFRLHTGQSFREFLRETRLREAVRLLQDSDHAVKVIYGGPCTFSYPPDASGWDAPVLRG